MGILTHNKMAVRRGYEHALTTQAVFRVVSTFPAQSLRQVDAILRLDLALTAI